MNRPDIDYLKEVWGDGSYSEIEELIEYVEFLEAQDRRRDWPKSLHEQYLKVLDERDELQEIIEELESDKAILRQEKSILMRELSNFTNNA